MYGISKAKSIDGSIKHKKWEQSSHHTDHNIKFKKVHFRFQPLRSKTFGFSNFLNARVMCYGG